MHKKKQKVDGQFMLSTRSNEQSIYYLNNTNLDIFEIPPDVNFLLHYRYNS